MRVLHGILAIGLVAGVACGGAAAGTGGAQEPTTGGTTTTADGGTTTTSASATTTTTTTTTTGGMTTTTGAMPVHVDMKAPVATGMVSELTALGIDVKDLPRMDKLDPKALRGVMKLLARSLGGKCADCHLEGDFAAPTPRKKIATKMWNEFAVKLTAADGGPVFCDSCHQGRIVQLDRTDKKALAKWMDASFVDGFKRKDGKAVECETCHVDMEMKFLSLWAR